jgi:hypothetical protein
MSWIIFAGIGEGAPPWYRNPCFLFCGLILLLVVTSIVLLTRHTLRQNKETFHWPSETAVRIEGSVMWSSLAIYAVVWVLGLSLGLGGEWLLGVCVTIIYVGMHVYEITQMGHCYLSADSTAVPVTLILFSLSIVCMWAFGCPPQTGRVLLWAWGVYGLTLLCAHLVALAYSLTLAAILKLVFQRRIAADRRRHSESRVTPGGDEVA